MIPTGSTALVIEVAALKAEVTRLTAELAANAKASVGDEEVASTLMILAVVCRSNSSTNKCQCGVCKAAQVLTRLAAAKASAERERDEARNWEGPAKALEAARAQRDAAEAKLREAREALKEAHQHLASDAIDTVRRSRAMTVIRSALSKE